jgi:CRISPR type III-A-associated protein Csm2
MSQLNRGFQGKARTPGQAGGQAKANVPAQATLDTIWPGYLQGGYFDTDGNLKVEYVSRVPVERLAEELAKGEPALTQHQVRRYFGHCRAIETEIRSGGRSWASILPEVKKLDIAVADGIAKRPPKIPKLFHEFIRCNVAVIKSEKDFLQGFLPHFEALVGFGFRYFRRERS